MTTPFPGMDPYLEQPGLWSQVHTALIIEIQQYLTPRLRPRYRVAVEQRTYLSLIETDEFIGEPDVLVVASHWEGPSPTQVAVSRMKGYLVDIPMPEEIVERYLVVYDTTGGEAVTVIELLSPSNKMSGRGRLQYERKRQEILVSDTNLIEIDLLRSGRPMPMRGRSQSSHYRILVSRAIYRPRAELFAFSVREPIPDVPIPLRLEEEEALLPLNQILHELYDKAGYDLFIDYGRPPAPPLSAEDATWATQLIKPERE